MQPTTDITANRPGNAGPTNPGPEGETSVEQAPGMATDTDEGWVPLVDVSELPATAILASDDTVLARSLRQVIRSLADPNGVIAAFDSFASDE
jgi:FXSXX-COOH protein